jgi:DNA-binding beta-propeller fold protein YncE
MGRGGAKVVAVVVTTLSGLGFVSAPALASRPHEFSGSFGERCMVEPCVGAQLKEPSGVAVNKASGDVYVVEKGDNRVQWFNGVGRVLPIRSAVS